MMVTNQFLDEIIADGNAMILFRFVSAVPFSFFKRIDNSNSCFATVSSFLPNPCVLHSLLLYKFAAASGDSQRVGKYSIRHAVIKHFRHRLNHCTSCVAFENVSECRNGYVEQNPVRFLRIGAVSKLRVSSSR